MNEQDWKVVLTRDGFTDLGVHTFAPNIDFGEHTHTEPTVHVILKGSLILIDASGEKALSLGERFDISAGTTHTAKSGSDGCTVLVGVKK